MKQTNCCACEFEKAGGLTHPDTHICTDSASPEVGYNWGCPDCPEVPIPKSDTIGHNQLQDAISEKKNKEELGEKPYGELVAKVEKMKTISEEEYKTLDELEVPKNGYPKSGLTPLTVNKDEKTPPIHDIPMGISEWIRIGKKYGYDKYLLDVCEKHKKMDCMECWYTTRAEEPKSEPIKDWDK